MANPATNTTTNPTPASTHHTNVRRVGEGRRATPAATRTTATAPAMAADAPKKGLTVRCSAATAVVPPVTARAASSGRDDAPTTAAMPTATAAATVQPEPPVTAATTAAPASTGH